jgi:glycosyltransferase involved in cell wall biosynthesis
MNINLLTPVNNLGYGYTGYYLLKHLNLLGHKVSLFPIGGIKVDDGAGSKMINQSLQNAQTYDRTANSVRIYHQFSLAEHVGKGKHIGFPIFELNRFLPVEKHHIEQQDKVLVCSEWAKGIVLSETRQANVDVVPLGVDQEVIRASKDITVDVERHHDTECVFLNIGKWEVRKGHAYLTETFNEAFTPKDKVELWMMCDNPFLKQEERTIWEQKYLDTPMGRAGRIRLVPRVNTQAEVLAVMRKADVGVWPALAEGWNLELLEMMALGKQVIATNYSAHTEFCNEGNAHLIAPLNLVPAYARPWFYGQGEWASFDKEQLANTLKEVYSSNEYREINHSGILTGKLFSWENAARKLVQTIDF